jgi:hypothetical protein
MTDSRARDMFAAVFQNAEGKPGPATAREIEFWQLVLPELPG